MKSFALLFLVISVVFITMGYMERKIEEKEENKVIEYRFIPRSFLEEQTYSVDLKKNFANMFDNDAYLSSAMV
mgnify:CR=1 FL=1|tara:strand:- start:793 stop:1011 length:219 start_codon:yes stop_codon:yes gene_type:complete